MKARLVIPVIAALLLVVAACGAPPARTSIATLPKLPVNAAPGASAAAVGEDRGSSQAPSFAPVQYRLGGTLPRLPATAPAYDVAAGSAGADRHRIAAALGLADNDRHLFLGSETGWWSFDASCEAPPGVDLPADGIACASTAIAEPVGGLGKPPVAVRPADLPTREAAVEEARSVFRSLGVDVSGDGLHLTDGTTQWYVTADPTVGGLPTTGRSVGATIGRKGSLLSARGFVGTPRKLGDYRLVDAATVGFKRLLADEANRPRPMMATDMPCRADLPNCGQPLTPEVVTITGVHLALQQVGSRLVPVFVFEAGPLETAPPVVAVIEEQLQTTTPATPAKLTTPPMGEPAGPAGVAPSGGSGGPPGGAPTKP